MPEQTIVRIKRQDGPGQAARWEEFRVPYKANANVISLLMDIQRTLWSRYCRTLAARSSP